LDIEKMNFSFHRARNEITCAIFAPRLFVSRIPLCLLYEKTLRTDSFIWRPNSPFVRKGHFVQECSRTI